MTDQNAALDACKKMKVASVFPEMMTNNDTDLVRIPDTPSTVCEAWLVTHESRLKDPNLKVAKQWIEACFVDFLCAQKKDSIDCDAARVISKKFD